MQTAHTIAELRAALAGQSRPVFVPTMGNLHAGHLQLVAHARQIADAQRRPVVASVFVNRLQFLPHEDFDRYPRTLQADAEQLAAQGCDWLFAPDETELYPQPQTFKVTPPAALADILEGAFRPGFFTGVCTVVMKLLQIIQPAVMVMGQKDFQQLTILQAMVRQFALDVEVVGLPTVRAEDDLALSSRNAFLSEVERAQAIQLSQALRELAQAARASTASLEQLQVLAMQRLRDQGWQPQYMEVRRQADLAPPAPTERASAALVVLGAAILGKTRLIDNLLI